MRVFSRIMLLCLLCALSACATDANLTELRKITPRGTPFAIALTQNYLKFSEVEAEKYDWVDSSYFAEKGLRSGYGHHVAPEEIINWNIPEDIKPELIAAREKLMAAIDTETQQTHPEESADAVFAFDCWLEELDEAWDSNAIESCQTRFYSALESLEFAKIQETRSQISNTAYLIYFGHNLTQFDEASEQVVRQVVEDVRLSQTDEIIIHGHTDSKGSENYNMNLSEKRALSVLEALLQAGIPKALLSYFAFGETDPVVNSGDGVSEPKNRRVEIFLG